MLEQVANMMVMRPYPGYEGEFFSMPCRNIVPKPAQKPHPPLWVAGKPELAARLGMGCLGFNVVGGHQAKVMVDRYYDTLIEECVPIGHGVNPQIGVLTTMHCNEDADINTIWDRTCGSSDTRLRSTTSTVWSGPGAATHGQSSSRSRSDARHRRRSDDRDRDTRMRSTFISGRCRTPASTRCS